MIASAVLADCTSLRCITLGFLVFLWILCFVCPASSFLPFEVFTFLFPLPSSSCLNNGTCIDDINTFSCRCRPGFYGTFCEFEQNECDSQPCKNGGTCTDGLGTYRCTCPVGYNGQNCQVQTEEGLTI